VYFGLIKKETPRAIRPLRLEIISSFFQFVVKKSMTPGEEVENWVC
jgi:hypothetical protein